MLVSICIPTYNRLEYLQQAVQSSLNQSYTKIEICISQDPLPEGPEPAIKSWCEKQAESEKKIIYQLNETNLGLAGNWNKLVQIANGEYVIIIGDDDLLKENFISSMVQLINETDADVCFSNQEFINEQGAILSDETERLNKIYKRDQLNHGLLNDPIQSVFNNSIPMSAALIRTDLLRHNSFDEEVNTPEFEVFLRLTLSRKRFAFFNQQLALYRIHTSSATSSGLTIDKLLKKIIDISVPKEYEDEKNRFISTKIISAINISLKKNDKHLAKRLLTSKFYPINKRNYKFLQTLLLYLPFFMIKKFYRIQASAKK